jgi:hypothetical protein
VDFVGFFVHSVSLFVVSTLTAGERGRRAHPAGARRQGRAAVGRRAALTPGCQIAYVEHTGCHQVNRVLTHNNNVVEKCQPYLWVDHVPDDEDERRRIDRGNPNLRKSLVTFTEEGIGTSHNVILHWSKHIQLMTASLPVYGPCN